jgi:4-amino-4-deoxy-L-arabinose transferase-like glycosyltransferase
MTALANSVLRGDGLGSPFGVPTGPTAFFAPTYPLFVAGVFRMTGARSLMSALTIVSVQILLALLTVWIVIAVTQRLFGSRAANIAGLLWACSLPLLWLPTILWDTCLSTCVLAGLVLLALRCSSTPSRVRWMALGASCGGTILINPALFPCSIALFLWALWTSRPINWKRSSWALLLAIVVASSWPIRNIEVFHTWIPTRSNMGYEFWMGNHPGSSGFLEEAVFPTFNHDELAMYESLGEVGYNSRKAQLSQQYVKAHPLRFVGLSAQRMIRFWMGTGTRDGSLVFALHSVATTILGFLGGWLLLRRGRFATGLLLAIPLALFPLPYYVTHAEFRFRVVIDPILTMLTGYAISRMAVDPRTDSIELSTQD